MNCPSNLNCDGKIVSEMVIIMAPISQSIILNNVDVCFWQYHNGYPVIDVFDVRLIFGATLPEFPWLACNAQSSASFSQGTTAWVQLINYSRYCAVAFINTLRLRQDGRLFADDIFNAFSWMKKYEFQLKFHCLFLRVQLALTSIGSDNGLAPNRWQAIIWTNAG